jgi:AcrR family transcriptional regulator
VPPRGETRARLLDAAAQVVRRDGPQNLTLDAVAAQAGVSKGGLLYHFRGKRELVEALVDRWLTEFQQDIDAAPDGFARGYVRASAPGGVDAEELGLLAALVGEPSLLAPMRERYAVWQDRIEREGGDPVDTTVARLAADGLWFAELFGLAPPRGELRDAVLARLLTLCD